MGHQPTACCIEDANCSQGNLPFIMSSRAVSDILSSRGRPCFPRSRLYSSASRRRCNNLRAYSARSAGENGFSGGGGLHKSIGTWKMCSISEDYSGRGLLAPCGFCQLPSLPPWLPWKNPGLNPGLPPNPPPIASPLAIIQVKN